MKTISLFAIAVSLLMAGVAAASENTDDAAEKADPRLGTEVDRVCFSRSLDGWKTVDKEDGVLLLERGANHWYRVELQGACTYRKLRWAHNISIDSWSPSRCVRRGDVITVHDMPVQSCIITRINEWDDDAPAPGEEEVVETANDDA